MRQALKIVVLALVGLTTAAPGSPYHYPPPPRPPHHGPGSGCGELHPAGYHGPYNLTSGGLVRNYTVQVPASYNPHCEYPLIFDYHGNGGNSTSQRNNSQYYLYTNDYLVVYPQGWNKSWEGPSYAVPGVDDLQFTTDLLAHIESEYCVDTDRVYASGKSNGAGFVDLLACSDAGDAFAAFGMASAALYTDNSLAGCSKRRAILESHGDEDLTIPYSGGTGKGGQLPDIDEWVQWWGERDCGPHAKSATYVPRGVTGYNVSTFSCGRYRNVVEHYQVFELGHCWPNAFGTNYDALTQEPEQHCDTVRVLDFTPKVLEFFGRWLLRNAPRN